MCHGGAGKEKNGRCCYADKGFICVYALLILQIFLLFVMMVTQLSITFAHIHKDIKEEHLDVAILHGLQKHMKVKQEKNDVDEEALDDEEVNDEESRKEEQDSWNYAFKGITIHYELQGTLVHIDYVLNGKQHNQHAKLDESDYSILDYAYDGETSPQ